MIQKDTTDFAFFHYYLTSENLKPISKMVLTIIFLLSFTLTPKINAQNSSTIPTNKKQNISDFNAPLVTISGTITGEGQLLPGVNVYLKGTNTGTVTDINGAFEITGKFKAGNIIVFSSLGYQTQEHILTENFKDNLYLSLKITDYIMDEVQIIGAGSSKKVYSSKKNLWQKIAANFK